MINKRGQGLSTNAIILIVLGVLVLVVLIVGFTMGWDRIAPWLSSNNVDTIAQQCGIACSTNAQYEFCSVKRELKADETLKDVTCYYLSEKENYGVGKCSAICDATVTLDDCGVGDTDKIYQKFDESTNTLKHDSCPLVS